MNNELEDMKNIWQQAAARPDFNPQQLEQILLQRSRDAMSQMRQNLYIEFGLGILITAAFVCGVIWSPGAQAKWAAVQALCLILPMFVFYYFAVKNLQKGVAMTGNLKESLRESLTFWNTALRAYFWYGVLIFPALFVAVRWWRLAVTGTGELQFFTGGNVVIALKMMLFWGFLAALLWGLIHYSYARWVQRLRDCLNEMSS